MTKENKPRKYELLLFDLGGVLVRLTGVPRMMHLTNNRYSVEQLWEQWIYSVSVREYESGKISTAAFGRAIVNEFAMDIDPQQYCEEFKMWPSEKYSGVNTLLQLLGKKVRIASLSNTNELHWDRIAYEMDFVHLFDYNFPSHKTGLLKPDRDAFLNVAEQVGISPDRILFFDDNEPNVQGARDAGLDAIKIAGFEELMQYFEQTGWL